MKRIINKKFLYALYNDRFEYINNINTTINNKIDKQMTKKKSWGKLTNAPIITPTL